MNPAEIERTTAEIEAVNGGAPGDGLRAVGSVIRFDGFIAAYTDQKEDDAAEDEESRRLPEIRAGEALKREKIDVTAHTTEPPPRYTEATLIKKMEELGIGRPSTYTAILKTLEDRDYVTIDKRRLIPQAKGRLLSAFLESFFKRYVEYDFTASLEEKLDEISDGKLDYKVVLRDFWRDFSAAIAEIKDLRISEVLDALNEDLAPLLFPVRADGSNPRTCPRSAAPARCRCGWASSAASSAARTIRSATSRASFRRRGRSDADGESEGPQEPRQGPLYVRGHHAAQRPLRPLCPAGRRQGGQALQPAEGLDAGDSIDHEKALALLALPRDIGQHPESGKMISAGLGRYGPFVLHDGTYANLETVEDVFSIGLNRAVSVLADKVSKGRGGRSRGTPAALKDARRASGWRRGYHGARRQIRSLRELGQGQRDPAEGQGSGRQRHGGGGACADRREGRQGRRQEARAQGGVEAGSQEARCCEDCCDQDCYCKDCDGGEEAGREKARGQEGCGEGKGVGGLARRISSKSKTVARGGARSSADYKPTRDDILKFITENPDLSGKREIAKAFNLKGDDRVWLKDVLRDLLDEGLVSKERKRMARVGTLPPISVLDIYGRDSDGGLLARPVDWNETFGPLPIVSIRASRGGVDAVAAGIGDRVMAKVFATAADDDLSPSYTGRVMKIFDKRAEAVLGVVRVMPSGEVGRIMPIERRGEEMDRRPGSFTAGAKDGDLVEIDVVRMGRFGLPRAQIKSVLGSVASGEGDLDDRHPRPRHSRTSSRCRGDPRGGGRSSQPACRTARTGADLPLITIDPADAKDHDDAVYAEPDTDPGQSGRRHRHRRHRRCQPPMSRPKSALDREALKRGNSVYFPDRVVPMLPERISNDLCSLKRTASTARRLPCAWFLAEGRKIEPHLSPHHDEESAAKLSYQQAQAAIDGNAGRQDRADPRHDPEAALGGLRACMKRRPEFAVSRSNSTCPSAKSC
jgi:hypothetical protein